MHLKKGMHGILEVKTTTVLNSMHKEKWGDSVPQNYFIQTLHYLNVTKWDFVILVALLRFDYGNNIFSQLRQYGYLASDRLEDMRYLEAEEDKWWNEYYLKSQEPPLRLPSL
jgi:predicted phage-related endonuclease